MDRIMVEKATELGGAVGSILRRPAIDEPTLWAGMSIVPAGGSTGWHHHCYVLLWTALCLRAVRLNISVLRKMSG